MTTSTIARALLVPAAAMLTVSALSGCSVIQDTMSSSVTTTADSREDLSGDLPAWMPADASNITRVKGSKGDAVSILLSSAKDLDTDACVETTRLSAPTMQVNNAPNVYKEDTVFSCGDWAVVPTSDGWYGWTPASESTTAPSPTKSDS
jgi:hypothetical protein